MNIEVIRIYPHRFGGVGHALMPPDGLPLCGRIFSFSLDDAPFGEQDCKNCWRVLRAMEHKESFARRPR